MGFIIDKSFMGLNQTLKKYLPEKGETVVVIPDGITKIGKNAFTASKNVKKIIMPDSVVEIEQYAFSECHALEDIVFSKNLKKIHSTAFSSMFKRIPFLNKILEKMPFFIMCGVLIDSMLNEDTVIPDTVREIPDFSIKGYGTKILTIPASVEKIGAKAFFDCRDLERVDVSEDNPNYSSEDGVLFDKSGKTLLFFPPYANISNDKSFRYRIPDGTEIITQEAFQKMRHIYLEVPESIVYFDRKTINPYMSFEYIILHKDGYTIKLKLNKKDDDIYYLDYKKNVLFYIAQLYNLKDNDSPYTIYHLGCVPLMVYYYLRYNDEIMKNYLSENIVKCVIELSECDDEENITKILHLADKKATDEIIEYAIGNKKTQLQLIATKYKHDNFEFEKGLDNFFL